MEAQKNGLVENLRALFLYVVPYAVSIGLLYLWGFWAQFDVNILQYAGVMDVVASALFPFAYGLAASVAVMIFGEAIGRRLGPLFRKVDHRVANSQDDTRRGPEVQGRTFREEASWVLGALVFLVIGSSDFDGKWAVLFALVAIPVARFLVRSDWRIVRGFEAVPGFWITFIVIMLPLSGFVKGNDNARNIISGLSYSYLMPSSEEGSELATLNGDKERRFLGHVGEYDFFFRPTEKNNSDC